MRREDIGVKLNISKEVMNNQEIESKELTEEIPKTRKRKILTNPEGLRASCKVCKEPGNLENMIRHGIPIKNSAGVE
jgi:5-methylcytosine-specific restriction endonuclease McrA